MNGPETAPPVEAVPEMRTRSVPVDTPAAERRTLLHYLGLPFYYRHTPPQVLRRTIFWGSAAALLLLFSSHAIMMPVDRDSLLHSFRQIWPFDGMREFSTIQSGFATLYFELTIFAIIISSILAPLHSTYSFCTERVTGTLEFLRLAPMPTTGLVLGKLFAPAWPAHAISAALLVVSFPMAWLGELELSSVFLVVLSVVGMTITITAIGGLLACATSAMRGFVSVGALLTIGFFLHFLPMIALELSGLEFVAFLSPWGALDTCFWQEFHSSTRYVGMPKAYFMGVASLAWFFIAFFHLALSALLVWASANKLDHPEHSALSRKGWLLVWGLFALSALGIVPNPVRASGVYSYYGGSWTWLIAAFTMLWAFAAVCGLALLDHPFSRDAALTESCERMAGHPKPRGGILDRIGHAGFAALLVFISGALIVFGFNQVMLSTSRPSDLEEQEAFTQIALLLWFGATGLAWLVGVILEAIAVKLRNFVARVVLGHILIGLLAALVIVPLVDVQQSYYGWRRSLDCQRELLHPSLNRWPSNSSQQQRAQWARQNAEYELKYLRKRYDFDRYVAGLDTPDKIDAELERYKGRNVSWFWAYHPQAMLLYPCPLLLFIVLMLFWRRWTYRGLEREARKALKLDAPPAPQPS
ncbi:MAG: hypothetical protein AMXMBFR7_09980 [Planctomycetota bacterium]